MPIDSFVQNNAIPRVFVNFLGIRECPKWKDQIRWVCLFATVVTLVEEGGGGGPTVLTWTTTLTLTCMSQKPVLYPPPHVLISTEQHYNCWSALISVRIADQFWAVLIRLSNHLSDLYKIISVRIAEQCWMVLIRLSNHWVPYTKLSTSAIHHVALNEVFTFPGLFCMESMEWMLAESPANFLFHGHHGFHVEWGWND